jgi:hypothetical protein
LVPVVRVGGECELVPVVRVGGCELVPVVRVGEGGLVG